VALFGGTAGAAIVVDATSSAAGTGTSITWSHTVGTGLNRLLIVGVSVREGNVVPNAVTYGGAPLTIIGALATGKGNAGVSLWGLASPTSGTAGIIVTLGSAQEIAAGSVSLDGVDQTTPWGAFASVNGKATNASLPLASAPGEVIVDVLAVRNGGTSVTPGGGQAQRWTASSGGGALNLRGAGSSAPGAASVTMSWTLSAREKFALGAVPILPAILQADAMIKLGSEPDTAYLTDDLYENPVALQSKALGVVSGSTAAYSVRFENDALLVDDLIITGTAGGGGFTVQYLDDTGTDRTAAVTGGGFTIAALPAGANRVWTLNVTPDGAPAPVPGGTSYTVAVTAASGSVPTADDQVEAVTTSISANLTLAKSVDKATAIPTEDLTYSVVATNGTGLGDATGIIVGDPIPANTGFRVGSGVFNAGTSSLTATVSYSSDGGTTWTYVPMTGSCGAPAGYDDCVTDIRWTMAGGMQADENFSVGFVVRVK
jgi:uncharacterized repeat protein (TIGR01451 family)